jgi:hypothetical protein
VWTAFELDDQLQRRAVEVYDEAVEDLLAAKLETEQAAIAQERPRVPFRGRGLAPKLARARELRRR